MAARNALSFPSTHTGGYHTCLMAGLRLAPGIEVRAALILPAAGPALARHIKAPRRAVH